MSRGEVSGHLLILDITVRGRRVAGRVYILGMIELVAGSMVMEGDKVEEAS